ncbi:multiheme c-type cytochrome [Desulfobacula sp.]|uniref:multiheme c-type cytochrome n=1 Tax=Desulfobacula sp. TaxID=2593537 RepID=UPI00261A1BEA|nr:multiheme c-type cytochrome [Desulfobacula sp.]
MKKTIFFTSFISIIAVITAVQLIMPITARSSQKKITSVIRGVVASQYGMVADARVRIAGSKDFTLTDVNGRFTVEAPLFSSRTIKITAGKDGWFNNSVNALPGNQNANVMLFPIPAKDNPNYRFISPAVCARCHNTLAKYWDKSKMAHTTSNVKVLNMYNGTDATGRELSGPGYKIDNPGKDGNCVSCHAPSAAVSNGGAKDIEKALWSPRAEWDGISCDYCHKIRKITKTNNTPSLFKSHLKRQTPLKGNSILVFGPYDDVVNTVMSASYSPAFDKGNFCAACHSQIKKSDNKDTWNRKQVYTDAEWKSFDIGDDSVIPVQTTYQEWKTWQNSLPADDSNKGKRCQDCHMSWRKEMLPYDNYIIDGQARNMWGTKRDPQNIRPHHFDGGTQIQLKTALSMEIEGEINGNILDVNVFITNTNGGHWIPTGDPMRNVMMVLSATDSDGKVLKKIKGEELPTWTGIGKIEDGNYAGLPGKMFSKVLKDKKGNINVPFWQATEVAADTRIRPKTTIKLTYQFKIENPDDEPVAEAKLIYRPFMKSLAKVKKWESNDILITQTAW